MMLRNVFGSLAFILCLGMKMSIFEDCGSKEEGLKHFCDGHFPIEMSSMG